MHPHSPRHHHLGVLRHSFEFAPTQQAHPRYANDYKLEWCCTSYVNSRAECCSCPYWRAPGEFEQGELAAGFHSCRGANIKMIHVVVSVISHDQNDSSIQAVARAHVMCSDPWRVSTAPTPEKCSYMFLRRAKWHACQTQTRRQSGIKMTCAASQAEPFLHSLRTTMHTCGLSASCH